MSYGKGQKIEPKKGGTKIRSLLPFILRWVKKERLCGNKGSLFEPLQTPGCVFAQTDTQNFTSFRGFTNRFFCKGLSTRRGIMAALVKGAKSQGGHRMSFGEQGVK